MSFGTGNRFRKKKLVLGLSSAIAFTVSCGALGGEKLLDLNIEKQGVGNTLMELGEKAGVQIILPQNLGLSFDAAAIQGKFTLVNALNQILKGSDLKYKFVSDSSVLISDSDDEEENSEKKDEEIEDIVVTGSRLVQDPGKLTRQVTTISREELEASGMSRLDEYLRRLPQNLNAPSNVASGTFESGVSFGRGANVFAGSGVNLRGLGEQYTLILIDGRRPAKGGLFGDVTDISSIPISQVERIEILYDGAAAIYGADAVGGVVNIITNRNFEGTNISIDITRPEDNGAEELNVNIGHTFNFGDSQLTLNGSYQSREPLVATDRNIPFTPLPAGGQGFALSDDQNLILYPSSPANIGTGFSVPQVLMYVKDVDGDGRTDNEALDERLSGSVLIPTSWGGTTRTDRDEPEGYIPVYTLQLPEGRDTLSLYDIQEDVNAPLPAAGASQEETLIAMRARFPLGENSYVPGAGYSLLPEDETLAGSLNYNYQVSDDLSVNLAARYSKSTRDSSTRNDTHQYVVTWSVPNNPFNSNFFFNYSDGLPQTVQEVEVENTSVSGGFEYDLNDNWSMQFGFGFSESDSVSNSTNSVNSSALGAAVQGRYYDYDVYQYVENGLGYFKENFGYNSYEEYVSNVIIPLVHTNTVTESTDIDISLTGVVAELPAGDMRTNIILSHNKNTTDIYSEQFFSFLNTANNYEDGVLLNESSGSTRNGIGMELSAPLLDTLLANVNGRYEKYDNIDDTALNWAAGFNWEPVEWMTVRLNRTFSTIVPDSMTTGIPAKLRSGSFYLRDENRGYLPGYPRETAFYVYGGNDSLTPETNYGTTLGIVVRPLEGLEIQANLTDSNTFDRIGIPGVNIAYTPSELTAESIASNPILYQVQNGQVTVGNQTYTESSVTATSSSIPLIEDAYVFDRREINLGDASSRSADFQLRYRSSTDFGDWFLTYTHQYMMDFEIRPGNICGEGVCISEIYAYDYRNRVAAYQPADTPFDQVGSIDRRQVNTRGYYPLPEHRGSFDVTWSYRGLSANLQTTVQSETSIIEEERREGLADNGDLLWRINTNEIITKAATPVNLNIGYDFSGDLFDAPNWLKTTRVNLLISNLFYDESKISRKVLDQEFEPDDFESLQSFTPFGVDPYGRTLRLGIKTTF
ncbi:TonB-dependent receptor [Porticoccaceae bacterium LTM1]|nr:TonB-dependent receptor [Porticoccaceae bacterium LTM1]